MDDLTYGLRQLCQLNRDGSHATQADRWRSLRLMGRQLREAGFRRMTPKSLNERHAEALLARWKNEGLSAGTFKNRLAHLRWWAEKVHKEGIVPNVNSELGVPMRQFVAKESKARELGDSLDRITDPHVRASLSLQQTFGLRREESIKFQPCYADRGDHIALKGSWTKGGRERLIPITTPEQRAVLNQVHQLAGAGSLIPPHKTYIEQRHVYDGQCKAAGLRNMHGLRHRYAQARYEALTGWKAPVAGGLPTKAMSYSQRLTDTAARQVRIPADRGQGFQSNVDRDSSST